MQMMYLLLNSVLIRVIQMLNNLRGQQAHADATDSSGPEPQG